MAWLLPSKSTGPNCEPPSLTSGPRAAAGAGSCVAAVLAGSCAAAVVAGSDPPLARDSGESSPHAASAALQPRLAIRGRIRVIALLYDSIGKRYTSVRREEPRIAAKIRAALADARTVVNV